MKRFGLSPGERIKSKKDFDKIFTSGKTLISSDFKVKANFIIEQDGQGVKFAAAVSKKNGNAVWRNRIKRLLKEAFRLNKEKLLDYSVENKILLKIVFSPLRLNQENNRKICYDDIAPAVLDLMNKITAVK